MRRGTETQDAGCTMRDAKRRRTLTFLSGVLLLAVCTIALAQSPSVSDERVKRVGRKLLCLCGCTQILVECNHTNCGFSTPAVAALRQALARYDSDDMAIQAMVQQYGVQILAAPPAQGFNLSAWVTPFAAAAIGLFVIAVVLRRWKARPQETSSSGDAADDAAWRERVRREIEKELGEEGR